MLGGDGRDNQILLALWKAKSEREFDPEHEVTFYCVEEPEAHLHPHQQRKLADYLNNELPGQTLITTHSPQIVSRYKPNSIIRIKRTANYSIAANDGCSECINTAWDNLGYRMSILPAEAFFSSCVFLIEGPSEKVFYEELANAIDIDLDYYNISILSVDGIQFKVYVDILNALEIPWVIRTDNDVSKVPKKDLKNLAGINRCLNILNKPPRPPRDINTTQESVIADGTWDKVSNIINPFGAFLSKIDLETDLYDEFSDQMNIFASTTEKTTAIKHLKKHKAIHMRQLISQHRDDLITLKDGLLAKPLKYAVDTSKREL